MKLPISKHRKSKDNLTELIHIIEQNLASFPYSLEFETILAQKKDENQHSDAFCAFISRVCDNHFQFVRELSQYGACRIDIGIRHNSWVIFTIEAKVLPTPIYKDSTEHQYVYGKGGGIERFKQGKHGLDDTNNKLPINGMIAYIKKQDFTYWHTKVNQWIKDANWDDSELLTQKYPTQQDKYISQHPRKDGTHVTLHHFWVLVAG